MWVAQHIYRNISKPNAWKKNQAFIFEHILINLWKNIYETANVSIITFEFSTTCILFCYFYNLRQSLDLELRSVAYEYTVWYKKNITGVISTAFWAKHVINICIFQHNIERVHNHIFLTCLFFAKWLMLMFVICKKLSRQPSCVKSVQSVPSVFLRCVLLVYHVRWWRLPSTCFQCSIWIHVGGYTGGMVLITETLVTIVETLLKHCRNTLI